MSETTGPILADRTEKESPGFRYLNLIGGMFVATLLISNTIAGKPWQVLQFVFPGASIMFPVSYIFGDILTEVYGFAHTRQIIWTGFLANALMALVYWVAIAMPPAQFWNNQAAFATTLGQVPRVVFASLIAYLLGEFVNSYVLAKMKIWSRGRHLWTRIISSTIAGQGVDTFAFVAIAFVGVWPFRYVILSGASLYGFKVLYEVVLTPVTYAIVRFLKEKEAVDHYDVGTHFSPFRWSIDS